MKPMKINLIVCALAAAAVSGAQPLAGAIDIHVHADPDSRPRTIDAIDLARLAKARGMRGMVLKSHYEPTASMAYLVRKAVPGIEAWGGIDLNRSVGGINPEAVERMAQIKGGYGRVVWFPTFDSENQVRFSKENRPFVPVVRGGELVPEAKQVIALAVKYNLTVETGHSSPAEGLLIVREARRQGARCVVTHAMLAPVHMSIPQMQEAAREGAFLEFVYNGLTGSAKEFAIGDYVRAIRAIGPEHCILASDLGQPGNPLHPDGLEAFLRELRGAGVTPAELQTMAVRNPARALGL
jgi:hypothetical protein